MLPKSSVSLTLFADEQIKSRLRDYCCILLAPVNNASLYLMYTSCSVRSSFTAVRPEGSTVPPVDRHLSLLRDDDDDEEMCVMRSREHNGEPNVDPRPRCYLSLLAFFLRPGRFIPASGPRWGAGFHLITDSLCMCVCLSFQSSSCGFSRQAAQTARGNTTYTYCRVRGGHW